MADAVPIQAGVDWAALAAGLGDIPWSDDPAFVRSRSRDFFWYSPLLKAQLNHVRGDLVVAPRTEAEVLHVARLCVRHGAYVTARGAGTGNYGQAMPLHGGVVLDMSAMTRVLSLTDGVLRVQAGAKLIDIEAETRPAGWELRLFPSTRRTATIGGFVAGGSGGVGGITWGQLRDPGALTAARVVTMESEPRVIELRGEDVNRVQHAYGTNGIITEIEMPMAPAQPWLDVAVAFPAFADAARFCQALGEADAIGKRLVTALAASVVTLLRALAPLLPEGQAAALLMLAPSGLEAARALAARHGGTIAFARAEAEVVAGGATPIYEFTWNHTTLHALKADRTITYLQSLFPAPDNLALVEELAAAFGDEVPMHLEFVRLAGRVTCFGLQLVRFSTPERLAEIIRLHEARGCPVFDPHTYVLEDGGMKTTDAAQLAFKRLADPRGLLNPGKMRGLGANA